MTKSVPRCVVGGILGNAGVADFLEDTEKLHEEADSEGQERREFVTAWWATRASC